MKFYDFKIAPSPRRVRMVMKEKGIEVETIQIDLGAKAQFDDSFREINPRCTVPVLKLDDGTCLCENASIVRYLEEVYPEPPLLGHDPLEKALVAEWTARIEWEGIYGVAEALRNKSEFFKDSSLTGPIRFKQVPELEARGRKRATAMFVALDERLGQSPFLAGDHFSAADIAGFVFVDFAKWIKLEPAAELNNLKQWCEAIAARPSASS